jgi:hypothetical protein
LLKNNIERILFIYAIILSSISFFIILSFLLFIISDFFFLHRFYEFNFYLYNIFSWTVYYIFCAFIIIYLVELVISIIFIRKYIVLKNIRKIIPQIILSLFYILVFFYFILIDQNSYPTWKEYLTWLGFPALLAAISLFLSHLFITGYFNNGKIIIFWKIMSSLTSFLLLFSIRAIMLSSA